VLPGSCGIGTSLLPQEGLGIDPRLGYPIFLRLAPGGVAGGLLKRKISRLRRRGAEDARSSRAPRAGDLARYLSGSATLTAVWAPEDAPAAMRDLVRRQATAIRVAGTPPSISRGSCCVMGGFILESGAGF
jgi:hypothetical protein